jgi:glycosyltransferase involved in cell wall biosynthesis
MRYRDSLQFKEVSMDEPLITVIIPCYNSSAYISEAIESVLSQTYCNFELIVVNDGSTDNTEKTIRKYLDKIIYLKQENAGPAAARNCGIQKAQGYYVAFLDADDLWLPDKLQMQVQAFDNYAGAALVYTKFVNFEDQSGKTLSILPDAPSGMLFDKLLIESLILLSTVMIRRELLLEAGCFDEGLQTAEDTNLWLKIARRYRIDAVPEVLVLRRLHEANISTRVDISIGTLDNLDRIVALYPDVAPDRYEPMKRAYEIRGTAMASDLFYGGNFRDCRCVCRKLKALGIDNLPLKRLFLMTLLPGTVNNLLRSAKEIFRLLRRNCQWK